MSNNGRFFLFASLVLLTASALCCTGGSDSNGDDDNCSNTACNEACQTAGHPSGVCSAGECICLDSAEDASTDTSAETGFQDTTAETGIEDAVGTDTGTEDTVVTDTVTDTATVDIALDTVTDPTADPGPPDVVTDVQGCEIDPSTITGAVGQRLVFQSVNFEDDSTVIRNISAELVTFALDGEMAQPNWRIYLNNQANGYNLPANFPIPAHSTVRVYLRADGTNTADTIYLSLTAAWADLAPEVDLGGSELAVLAPNDGNTDPDAQEAYVRWGGDDPDGDGYTLRDEAAEAGVWRGNTVGDFVYVVPDSHGIAVTTAGDVTDPADWTNTASDDCL